MDDLGKVLKVSKSNKARYAHGHVYELFKRGGQALKSSLLKQVYRHILQPSNIYSFYKSKGRKDDPNNDRGVYNVVKIRTIMEKLIFNDKYDIIDGNMSCSNAWGKKRQKYP